MAQFVIAVFGLLLHRAVSTSPFHFDSCTCTCISLAVGCALALVHHMLHLPGGWAMEFGVVVVFLGIRPFGTEDEMKAVLTLSLLVRQFQN